MARWEPNARERLEKAAMELFRERGFDETAVADIAARAGLTERTFFRYFADKREVLFGGSPALQEMLVKTIAAEPAGRRPIDLVLAAYEATSPIFEPRRPYAKARTAIVATHPALMERELIKLAALGAAVAEALRARGVAEPAATLASEAGVAIFKLAFERWVEEDQKGDKKKDLVHHLRAALAQLEALTAPRPVRGPSRQRPRSAAR
ncbi:MAG TPA: TetR family transcriptional regulator [Polyangia bacterium]|nr:TetR family transcriptional regulator [Polyangia bacterium]